MSGGLYGTGGGAPGQAIFTDDVSLQVFMEHLKRLVRLSCYIGCKGGRLICGDVGCWRADELSAGCGWGGICGSWNVDVLCVML